MALGMGHERNGVSDGRTESQRVKDKIGPMSFWVRKGIDAEGREVLVVVETPFEIDGEMWLITEASALGRPKG